VDGTLIADGTGLDRITFTSSQTTPAKGDWYTLRLRTDNNLINNADIEYASYGVFMTFVGSDNIISNSTFKNCAFDGIYITNSDNNLISNCTSSYNDRYGITIYESYGTRVENCTVQYNNYFGINLNASTFSEILRTNFSYNQGKGILLYSNSHNTTISDCQVDWNDNKGIDLWGTYDNSIINTTVIGNNGIGIDFGKATKRQWIENCTITDNEETGIVLRGSSYSDIVGSDVSRNKGHGGIYSGKQVECINISHTNVLNNFVGHGIDLYKASWINITYSNISGNVGNGINFNKSVIHSNNRIQKCVISKNSLSGVYIFVENKGGTSYIQNNNIFSNTIYSNPQQGIFFHTVGANTHTYIRNNNIYLNKMYLNKNGILFDSYAQYYAYIQNNNFYLNTIYSHLQNGIYLRAGKTAGYYIHHNSIHQNTIYSNGENGIFFGHLDGSDLHRFYIENNDIYSNVLYSNQLNGFYFYAYASRESFIQNNNIYSNTIYQHTGTFTGQYVNSGIYIRAENPTLPWQESHIYDNKIISNSFGILFVRMRSHVVYVNNISNNKVGVLLHDSDGNTFRYNNVTYNDFVGFNITSSSTNNLLENNNITANNKTGLLITGGSNDNIIIRNNVTENLEIGLGIIGASGNRIHHNNFINNIQNAYDSTNALNEWDDGAEGNYWSDYLGTDDNGDGFGEDPYVIPGGGSRDWHPLIYEVDVTPPWVVITSPLDGEKNVQIDTTITITFSKEMDITAVEGAISISGGLTPTNFVWDIENKIVTFTPSSNLQSRTEYIVIISTEAKDPMGNRIKIAYVFKFWSEDIEAPRIILTSPFDGEMISDLGMVVVVTFEESMDPASVTYVCTPDPFEWTVVWNGNNTEVTFSHNDFDNQASYTFQILTAKDVAGLDLIPGPVPNPWTFTTADVIGPEIVATTPADGSQNVSATIDIVVSFNEELDVGTVTYSCDPDPLGWSVVWSNMNKTATFSHNEFAERTLYTYQITGAKDLSGNGLISSAVSNPFSFSTIGDYQGPQIILTSPADTEAFVQLDADVEVTFSEAIDTSSITFTCSPDPGGWSPSWTNGDTIVTYSHNSFDEGTTYSFGINSARDVAGNNLVPGALPNPFTFVTIGDITGPIITVTLPANNAVDIGLDSNITVTFNEAVDPSTMDYLCTPDPGGWSQTWGNGNTMVSFSLNPLEAGTLYTFYITALEDLSGNDLNPGPVPNPWSFTTSGDLIAPYITLTSPAHDDIDVGLKSNVVITFSEPIYTPSLDYICTPNPGGWFENWNNEKTILTLLHDPFEKGTTYSFQVYTAKDFNGNDLGPGVVPNPFSFTTEGDLIAPEIITTSPVDNELNVGLDSLIVITFSEPMDTSSVDYTCSPNPGGWFESWSSGDTVFSLLHNPFEMGISYTFDISSGRDLVGNNLTSGDASNPWEFSTISVASLIITPSESEIPVNGSIGLIAWAYDSQDNLISDITFSWSVNNDLGMVSPQGKQAVTLSASSLEGVCVVNVSVGDLSASAKITITKDEIEEVETQDEEPEDLLWLWFLILVIIILFVINLWVGLGKPKPEIEGEEPPLEEEHELKEEDLSELEDEEPIAHGKNEEEGLIGESDLGDLPDSESKE
jgi:parallel beta-helix repeat protein